jgi:hypothetical protein
VTSLTSARTESRSNGSGQFGVPILVSEGEQRWLHTPASKPVEEKRRRSPAGTPYTALPINLKEKSLINAGGPYRAGGVVQDVGVLHAHAATIHLGFIIAFKEAPTEKLQAEGVLVDRFHETNHIGRDGI